MSEQEIRVGQRWRRKSDGVEVKVAHMTPKGRGVTCFRIGSRGVWSHTAEWLRARYDLIETDQ